MAIAEFRCRECPQRKFFSQEELDTHMIGYHGMRQRCGVCGAYVRNGKELKRHKTEAHAY